MDVTLYAVPRIRGALGATIQIFKQSRDSLLKHLAECGDNYTRDEQLVTLALELLEAADYILEQIDAETPPF